MLQIESEYTLADEGENAPSPSTGGGSSIWSVIRLILTLAVVAAAIYGIVYLFKRKTNPASTSDPFLKVLASVHLGANRHAHIVNVGSQAWLLGSSDGGVNLIGEIDNKELIDAMMLEEAGKGSKTSGGRLPNFFSLLKRFGVREEERVPGADDIRQRRERFREL